MNKKQQNVFIIAVAVIAIVVLLETGFPKIGEIDNEKFDNCITLVQQYIPDPSDTKERSNFIRECYEKPNE